MVYTHYLFLYSPLVDLCSSYNFVHPLCTSVRYMFWTDLGARPLIGRSALDGSGRIDLVTTRLKYINALAIDFDTDTLYWADAYTDVIETSDLNGRYTCLLSTLQSYSPLPRPPVFPPSFLLPPSPSADPLVKLVQNAYFPTPSPYTSTWQ